MRDGEFPSLRDRDIPARRDGGIPALAGGGCRTAAVVDDLAIDGARGTFVEDLALDREGDLVALRGPAAAVAGLVGPRAALVELGVAAQVVRVPVAEVVAAARCGTAAGVVVLLAAARVAVGPGAAVAVVEEFGLGAQPVPDHRGAFARASNRFVGVRPASAIVVLVGVGFRPAGGPRALGLPVARRTGTLVVGTAVEVERIVGGPALGHPGPATGGRLRGPLVLPPPTLRRCGTLGGDRPSRGGGPLGGDRPSRGGGPLGGDRPSRGGGPLGGDRPSRGGGPLGGDRPSRGSGTFRSDGTIGERRTVGRRRSRAARSRLRVRRGAPLTVGVLLAPAAPPAGGTFLVLGAADRLRTGVRPMAVRHQVSMVEGLVDVAVRVVPLGAPPWGAVGDRVVRRVEVGAELGPVEVDVVEVVAGQVGLGRVDRHEVGVVEPARPLRVERDLWLARLPAGVAGGAALTSGGQLVDGVVVVVVVGVATPGRDDRLRGVTPLVLAFLHDRGVGDDRVLGVLLVPVFVVLEAHAAAPRAAERQTCARRRGDSPSPHSRMPRPRSSRVPGSSPPTRWMWKVNHGFASSATTPGSAPRGTAARSGPDGTPARRSAGLASSAESTRTGSEQFKRCRLMYRSLAPWNAMSRSAAART